MGANKIQAPHSEAPPKKNSGHAKGKKTMPKKTKGLRPPDFEAPPGSETPQTLRHPGSEAPPDFDVPSARSGAPSARSSQQQRP